MPDGSISPERWSYRCPECTGPNEFMFWVRDQPPNIPDPGSFPASWLVSPGMVRSDEPASSLYRCQTCGYECRVPRRDD